MRLIGESSFPEDSDSYSSSARSVDSVINLLAILHGLIGLLFIPYVYIIFTETIFYITNFTLLVILTYLIGGLMLMTIPVFFIVGLAIWKVKSWAWKTSVIMNAVCLILTILGQVIFPAMLNIVLLLMLNNRDVRSALQS